MTKLLQFALMLAAFLAASAGAAPPRVPAGQWAIEYQEDNCTLSRDGLGVQPGIAIRTRPLTDPHDLMIYGQFSRGKKDSFQGVLDLDRQQQGAARWVLIEPSRGRKRTLLKTTITPAELTRFGASNSVGVIGPDRFRVDAVAPGLAKGLGALRECEIYLAGRWGITRHEMNGWARPARPLTALRELFWDKNMSKVAMLRDPMRAVLTIDADGRLTGCDIVQTSTVSWVNARFCPTLRERARFEPARNAAGIAVPGKVITPPITSVRLR